MRPFPPLPPNVEVELEVRLTSPEGIVARGFMNIERSNPPSEAQFQAVGLALQAGAYEVLRAIWPQAVDNGPETR